MNLYILTINPHAFVGIYEEFWVSNNKLHREGGPAMISSDKTKCWYQNGKRHREDGPAIIFFDSEKSEFRKWYIEGVKLYDIIKV